MLSLLSAARAGLRARRRRALIAALGVFAAALVVGTCVTVSYGFSTGFARAAERADLPDVVARFRPQSKAFVDDRVAALPNLARRAYRLEVTNVELRANGKATPKGAVHVVLDASAPRGYAIVVGRDLDGSDGEVVIEQGLARTWSLQPGDRLSVGGLGRLRIAGVSMSPDNVAYPLASAARVYVGQAPVRRAFGAGVMRANVALLWLNDPARTDATLAQARVATYGVGGLRFVTRSGIRVLLNQAGGIVIALLVAFSLVALVAAGTMLAAGAQAEVQRRLPAFGVQRALGYTPDRIAAEQGMEAVLVAVPATLLGLSAGALLVTPAADDLLAALNEAPPGVALLRPLMLSFLAVVALFVAAATWPAWRAARRSPALLLRAGDLAGARARARTTGTRGGGLIALGARFVTARRGRWLAGIATIGACAGIALLMLALASLLERLRDDPGTLGKRYELTIQPGPASLSKVRAIVGVAAAEKRYSVRVADSFRLGESLTLVAYPGDHTRFEAPALAEGRRVRGPGEVEVGTALAELLGLRPGSTLAVQSPGGSELRFEVVGVVRALDQEGRVAFVQSRRVLAAEPGLSPAIAVALEPGANRDLVARRLRALGAFPQAATTAAPRNGSFVGLLAAVLRSVGLAVGLVCLYALVQVLAMTVRERRSTVAVLRASGADTFTLALVFAGAALAVALPAAVVAALLERVVLSPLVSRLASQFAALPLSASLGQVLLVVISLLMFALAAALIAARVAVREPVVAGLRAE